MAATGFGTGCTTANPGHYQDADRAEGQLQPFLGAPYLEVQELFIGERFPNVVVAMDGSVIATWGAQNYRVRRSEDGGQSWGYEIAIGSGMHGGGVVVDERSGDILVFVEQGHPPAPLTVYRSHDHGLTWQAEDVTILPDGKGNVPSMHMNERGITLRRGEYAGRLIRPSRSYASGNAREFWSEHYTNAIYSDDGGRTWHTSQPFPFYGTGEAAIEELSDGRLYYNSRRHLSTDGLDPRRRYEAWSDDGGETWEDGGIIQVLPDGPQSLDYGLMAGLVRLPVTGRDILVFSNVDSPGKPDGDDSNWSERRRGTLWVSFDGGATWPVKRLLNEGPFAYSSLTAGRPGTPSEGWIYLQFEGGPRGAHSDGNLARFNLSWLLEGEPTGDGHVPDWARGHDY